MNIMLNPHVEYLHISQQSGYKWIKQIVFIIFATMTPTLLYHNQ